MVWVGGVLVVLVGNFFQSPFITSIGFYLLIILVNANVQTSGDRAAVFVALDGYPGQIDAGGL